MSGFSIDHSMWLSVDTLALLIPYWKSLMGRSLHPKKEVEDALRYAEERGWRIEVGGSHAWGRIYCPGNDEECRCGEFCITSVWSTPKNTGNHARALRRVVDNCTTHRTRHEADDGAKE